MDRKHWSFVDERWLNTFGLGPLNVMQYFAMSPFYDPRSNNHALMTQNLDMSALTRMQGLEFMLDERPEYGTDVFVIKKQQRSSPDSVRVLEVYFIVQGVVYQSPSLMEVVASRMHKASVYLSRSLDMLIQEQHYSSESGHTLFDTTSSTTTSASTSSAEASTAEVPARPEMVRREMPPWQPVFDDLNAFVDQRLQQSAPSLTQSTSSAMEMAT